MALPDTRLSASAYPGTPSSMLSMAMQFLIRRLGSGPPSSAARSGKVSERRPVEPVMVGVLESAQPLPANSTVARRGAAGARRWGVAVVSVARAAVRRWEGRILVEEVAGGLVSVSGDRVSVSRSCWSVRVLLLNPSSFDRGIAAAFILFRNREAPRK